MFLAILAFILFFFTRPESCARGPEGHNQIIIRLRDAAACLSHCSCEEPNSSRLGFHLQIGESLRLRPFPQGTRPKCNSRPFNQDYLAL
jgi:hypothetical protein